MANEDLNDQTLAEEFRRGLRIVGPCRRVVSQDLGFLIDLGWPKVGWLEKYFKG